MSLTALFIKALGVILALAGLALILGSLGVTMFALTFINEVWGIVLGVILIILGVAIVKGKEPTL